MATASDIQTSVGSVISRALAGVVTVTRDETVLTIDSSPAVFIDVPTMQVVIEDETLVGGVEGVPIFMNSWEVPIECWDFGSDREETLGNVAAVVRSVTNALRLPSAQTLNGAAAMTRLREGEVMDNEMEAAMPLLLGFSMILEVDTYEGV